MAYNLSTTNIHAKMVTLKHGYELCPRSILHFIVIIPACSFSANAWKLVMRLKRTHNLQTVALRQNPQTMEQYIAKQVIYLINSITYRTFYGHKRVQNHQNFFTKKADGSRFNRRTSHPVDSSTAQSLILSTTQPSQCQEKINQNHLLSKFLFR